MCHKYEQRSSKVCINPLYQKLSFTLSRLPLSSPSRDKVLANLAHQIDSYVQTHPFHVAAAAIGIGLPIVSSSVLPLLGFGALGPGAGSIAAGWQASIGNVAAGSLFSTLQSAGMGGAAAGIFTGIGVTGGVVTTGTVTSMVTEKLGFELEDAGRASEKFASYVWGVGMKAVEEAKSTDLVEKATGTAKDGFEKGATHLQLAGKNAAWAVEDAFEKSAPHVEGLVDGVADAAKGAFEKGAPHAQRVGSDVVHVAKDVFEKGTPHAQQLGANVVNAAKEGGGKIGEGVGELSEKAKGLLDAWTTK